MIRASGRLHVDGDVSEAKQRLLEDWWHATQHDAAETIMLAYRRDDVRDLNQAARALMLGAGRLGDEPLTVNEREFGVGDRVLCRRNDPRLGVRTGLRGTVVDVDPHGRTLILETATGARRTIPAPYATQHLDYAYALTGHAAQGATVDRAFVLLPDRGAFREWGYVACSRARGQTCIYLAGAAIEPDSHAREPDASGPPERAARALSRSSAEPLALEQTSRQHDTTARLLARRREHLDRQRAQAEQRLAAAERQLQALGWRACGRRGLELRAESPSSKRSSASPTNGVRA